MLGVDEILRELERDSEIEGLPPGFRFHPTDEELITFYLASKVFNADNNGRSSYMISTAPLQIAEVDLNRCEPWELPDVAKMGEREWYFYSLRDRKYPSGLRTNRATDSGYWKATGKDKEVFSGSNGELVGMKKTLVFYRGRAPRGEKTKWVMHEYRLDGQFSCRHTCKEEWVICRIVHKKGEKKFQPIQLHNKCYITKPNPSFPMTTSSNSLPPLLEYQSNQDPQNLIENPFQINTQESDLKCLINPFMRQSDIFSVNNNATFSMSTANSSHQHQDFTLKELSNAIAKQCKKEPTTSTTSNSTHYSIDGLVGSNFNWANQRIQENNAKYQNLNQHHLLPFELEGRFGISNLGVSNHAIDAAAIESVMATQPPLGWW